MSNKKISLKTCLLLCVICIVCTTTVLGVQPLKQIIAYLNYGIDIVVDGEVKELHDANGNRVYPISYNGTTYVPVRGIGDILGVKVEWDSKEGNVVITTENKQVKEVENVELLKGLDKSANSCYVIKEESQKSVKVNNQDIKFENGLYCKMISNQDFHIKDFISVPMDKGVKKISFEAYSDVNSSVNIFNQQGKLLKAFYLKPNTINTFEYVVNGDLNTELYFVALGQSENIKDTNYVKVFNLYGYTE